MSESLRLNITKVAITAVIPTAIAPIGLCAIIPPSFTNAPPVVITTLVNALKPNNIAGTTFPTIVPNINKSGPIAATIPPTVTINSFVTSSKLLKYSTAFLAHSTNGIKAFEIIAPNSSIRSPAEFFN